MKASDLHELYPDPKTYEERQAAIRQTEANILARQPKYIILSISLVLYLLLILTVVIISIIPRLVALDAFGGVFFSFFLGLIWTTMVYWSISSISKRLNVWGAKLTAFLLAYALCVLPPVGAILTNSSGSGFMIAFAYASIAQLLLTFLILVTLRRKATKGIWRLVQIILILLLGGITTAAAIWLF